MYHYVHSQDLEIPLPHLLHTPYPQRRPLSNAKITKEMCHTATKTNAITDGKHLARIIAAHAAPASWNGITMSVLLRTLNPFLVDRLDLLVPLGEHWLGRTFLTPPDKFKY